MNVPDWTAATRLILEFEGFRGFPYDDRHPNRRWSEGMALDGTLTIGYGETNADICRRYVRSGKEMTKADALVLFAKCVPGYWSATAHHFAPVDLNPNQCAAITSLAYNAGPDGMKRFAPQLLEAIAAGQFARAAELWESSIVNKGKPEEVGLRRRRLAEAQLFLTPFSQLAAPPDPLDLGGRTCLMFVGE